VVAATHRDLERDVREGRFREDLYYRLQGVELALPPLRERREDLPALAVRFLVQLGERLGRPPKRLAADALARLAAHPWPGNVRELRNAVERAAVLAAGEEVGAADLALPDPDAAAAAFPDAAAAPAGVPFGEAKRGAMERFERSYLLRALRAHGGNVSRTAESIGMVRQSLQQKIRELGLREEDWSRPDPPAGGTT
jgi:DNA-binding NtrC family response regulator